MAKCNVGLRLVFIFVFALYLLAAVQFLVAGFNFFDGFDVAGTMLDTSVWTTEFGPPSFIGRTQLRDWVNGGNVGPFIVSGGNAQLTLDSFNPTGFSLYGTHAKTLASFQPTSTTDVVLTARLRLTSLQPGVVYGLYFYGCSAGPCASRHDELDIEIVTNYLQASGSPLRVQLNRYAAEPLGAGHGPVVNLPATFDPLAFHDWKIRWGLGKTSFFVDGIELFSATDFVPQGPMHANMVAWAPAADWPDAYDASLQPAKTNQQHYTALVDYVSVIPAEGSAGISAISATSIKATTAEIDWTTAVPSNSQVEYGVSPSYGRTSPVIAAPVTMHAVPLSSLAPSTTYHFRVRSRDTAGNLSVSSDSTFATLLPPSALVVTNTNDAGSGSLRQAVATARPGDTITFASAVSGTIRLNGEIGISEDLVIRGPGAGMLSLSGNGANRIFDISTGHVVISGVSLIAGTAAGFGGAIRNSGVLELSDCVFANNQAGSSDGVGQGGAIFSSNALSVTECQFLNNSSTGNGGAIRNSGHVTILGSRFSGNSVRYFGGALYNLGAAVIHQSTFDNNSAPTGGSIWNEDDTMRIVDSTVSASRATSGGGIANKFGALALLNSTVSGNAARTGGGILSGAIGATGNLSVVNCTITSNSADVNGGGIESTGILSTMNTLVASNSAGTGTGPDIHGNVISNGHNLLGDASGSSGLSNGFHGDLVGSAGSRINPRLGALADNGGPTKTHMLQSGSPAIDAGDNAALALYDIATDQRGGDRRIGLAVDIGALEVGSIPGNVSIHMERMNFPRLLTATDRATTGLAVVNPADHDALVAYTLYGNKGTRLAATLKTISAGSQNAYLASELFPGVTDPGWISLTSTTAGLQGFWLGGDFVTFADGAAGAPEAATLIFPLIGPQTEIDIANVGEARNDLTLQFLRSDGSVFSTASRSVAASEAFRAQVSALFPQSAAPTDGYLRVAGNPSGKISGTSVLVDYGASPSWAVANGIDPDVVLVEGYFSQAVSGVGGGGVWTTQLTLVNLSDNPNTATISFQPTTGNPISVVQSLGPHASKRTALPDLTGTTGYREGWIKVAGTAALTGSLVYADTVEGGLTVVPVELVPSTALLFSHLAEGAPWHTGIGLLNPSESPATVEVFAMASDGSLIGGPDTAPAARFTMPAGTKLARLITEWIPQTADHNGGFIFVRTTNNVPLFGTEVFFTRGLSVLANIPAAPILADARLPNLNH
jgi:predicted outer membrane repeat protein